MPGRGLMPAALLNVQFLTPRPLKAVHHFTQIDQQDDLR